MSIRAYGQYIQSPLLLITSPATPPAKAIPMGTEKLRIHMESSSCRAPIAIAARVPRRIQTRIWEGTHRGKPEKFSAEKKEHSQPYLGDECHLKDDCQLGKEYIGNGDRRGHKYIPVVIQVFQTPEIGTVQGDQGRIEETGIK